MVRTSRRRALLALPCLATSRRCVAAARAVRTEGRGRPRPGDFLRRKIFVSAATRRARRCALHRHGRRAAVSRANRALPSPRLPPPRAFGPGKASGPPPRFGGNAAPLPNHAVYAQPATAFPRVQRQLAASISEAAGRLQVLDLLEAPKCWGAVFGRGTCHEARPSQAILIGVAQGL